MKLTPRIVVPAIAACSFLIISAATNPVAAPVPALTPPCEATMVSIPTCPNTGCGDNGDALLNQAKNRVDAIASVTNITLSQIRAMHQPAHWDTGQARTQAHTAGEGKAVAVSGFLFKAKAEGAESCNCGLTKRADTDIHLVLVSQMPELDDQDAVDEAEIKSVTAEITPRVRQNAHPAWLFKNINDFVGRICSSYRSLDARHEAYSSITLSSERTTQ